jgi:hypothetical protein
MRHDIHLSDTAQVANKIHEISMLRHCGFHRCDLVVITTFVVVRNANSSCQQIKFREKWYWFEQQLIPTLVLRITFYLKIYRHYIDIYRQLTNSQWNNCWNLSPAVRNSLHWNLKVQHHVHKSLLANGLYLKSHEPSPHPAVIFPYDPFYCGKGSTQYTPSIPPTPPCTHAHTHTHTHTL